MKKRRTQIVCTIGPASRSSKCIENLIKAGMDVARLHFSYGKQNEQAENIRRLRRAARHLRRKVIILQDLSGTKVRLGEFSKHAVELKKGALFTLTSRPIIGSASMASINIPELISVIKRGDTVLLADGELQLTAISTSDTQVRCKVLVGGRIKAGQAVHVPGKSAPVPVPTPKDLDDVRFGLKHQVDWIAQSYVTSPSEIEQLRKFIREQGAHTPIIAKIERRQALLNLEAIVRAADMVMVGRGDLGLEIPLEQFVMAQKQIIHCSNRLRKPVITATEMLLSMMEKDHPTRAEVADVTNAILDGTDAVMLSGETTMGRFPIEAAKAMSNIASCADKFKAHSLAPQFAAREWTSKAKRISPETTTKPMNKTVMNNHPIQKKEIL